MQAKCAEYGLYAERQGFQKTIYYYHESNNR